MLMGPRFIEEMQEIKGQGEEEPIMDNKSANSKVADVFTEVTLLKESLSKREKELEIKEQTIASLQAELEKTKKLEGQMVQKDAAMEKLRRELSNAKASEALRLSLLSRSEKRIQELETELEKWKDSQMKMLDSFDEQTNRLEQANVLLEESNLEIDSLNETVKMLEESRQKYDEERSGKGLKSVKSDSELALCCISLVREDEEDKDLLRAMKFLKDELKQAVEAEEKSKKAMDDLALALTEVAAEANRAKAKLSAREEEMEQLKKESKGLEDKLRIREEEHKFALEKARKETDFYINTSERLRFEAEESGLAWNWKEKGFVDCIKRVEEEKAAAVQENMRLAELVAETEKTSMKAKEETKKLRDILRQAINEANVAKEAAEIVRGENSQLKDLVAEKDEALNLITQENETLRVNEAAAFEHIKDLKRLIFETSGKELKDQKAKNQNMAEKEQSHGKKMSNGFSFNIKELIIHNKHKDANEQQKSPEKMQNNHDDDSDMENADPLRGSIFDVADSPVAPVVTPHHWKISCSPFAFTEDKEVISPEDYTEQEGAHVEGTETDRNSRKKKALLRRFGNALTRRRSYHRRDLSVSFEENRKETGGGTEEAKREDHQKKDLSVSSGEEQQEGHNNNS